MSIFAGIAIDVGEKPFRQAAAAILDRADELGLTSRRWSLAELRLDGADYEWLCEWATKLRDPFTRLCLDSWRDAGIPGHDLKVHSALGLVLFALFTETGRRFARSKGLWSHIVDAHFGAYPPTSLFVQGQPSAFLKDALERTARSVGLRHLFGIEGMQNWYDSVQIQFGFSLPSCIPRLAFWLVGQQPPLSAEYLLREGPLYSESFTTLWVSLRRARKQHVTRARCLQVLLASCWVLPDWAEAVLDAALADTGGVGRENDELELPFLSKPRLEWTPPLVPSFVSEVINLPYFALEAPTYALVIANDKRAQLLRQPDGTYRLEPDEPIRLPLSHTSWRAELVDDLGDVDAVMELRLWDLDEEVTVFKMPGGAAVEDPFTRSLKPGASYALLLPDDLTVRPELSTWQSIPGAESKLWLLPSGWDPSETGVCLGEREIWHPADGSGAQFEPPWVSKVKVIRQALRVRIGEQAELDVNHPEGVEVTYVRVNRRPVEFETINSWTTRLAPITIDADPSAHRLRFMIGARCASDERRVRREVEMLIHGAARLESNGWVALSTDQTITVNETLNLPMKIYPPVGRDQVAISEWTLLEGDVFIRRLWSQPRRLERLAGLGAGLSIRRGPFNDPYPPMPVTASVVDHGIVDSVVRSPHNPRFALTVLGHLEPDDGEFQVVWWDTDGSVHTLTPTSWHPQSEGLWTVWTVPVPEAANEPLAVGVAYSGSCRGAWWTDDWCECLPDLFEADAGQAAAMVRWLHLPIHQPESLQCVGGLVAADPQAFGEAWARDLHLVEPLRHRVADEAWFSAVRTAIAEANLDSKGLAHLFAGLLSGRERRNADLIEDVVHDLMRLDPLLVYPVMRAGVDRFLIPKWGMANSRQALLQIERRLAGFSGESMDADSNIDFGGLANALAADLEFHPTFVKKSLFQPAYKLALGCDSDEVTDVERANVMLALTNLDPFRRALTILMLVKLRNDVLPPKSD